MEQRLDKILIERNLVTTRQRAESMIKESGVLVNGKLVFKPGKKFPEEAKVELVVEELPFVSRGALKLVQAIEKWQIDVSNHVCLDVGASTGGFTEVLLQKGASKVYALDVGVGQLVDKLGKDDRVVSMEKTNIREFDPEILEDDIDTIVVDVSFISLRLVLPILAKIAKPGTQLITLIKPQFEVGKDNVGKNGIVKEPKLHTKAINETQDTAIKLGFEPVGICDSPIKGGDGNKEFLMLAKFK